MLRSRRRRCHVYHGSPGHFEIILTLVRYRCYLQQNAKKNDLSNEIDYLTRAVVPSAFTHLFFILIIERIYSFILIILLFILIF